MTPRLEELPIGSISPNPHQPRVHFDEESLAELAASIREIGVLQPVLVRPLGDGRLRAARRRASLAGGPPCRSGGHPGDRARRPTTSASVERALVENLHRQDLTPLEEAAAYQQLIEDFELTHEQIASAGRQEPLGDHATRLRLMSLPAVASSTCSPTVG